MIKKMKDQRVRIWKNVRGGCFGNCDVVTVDFRGHGGSRNIEYGFTFARLAKDVNELLNHLKIEKCSFLTWSLGSEILMEFIEQNGIEQIEKIIIADQLPALICRDEYPYGVFKNAGSALSYLSSFVEGGWRKTIRRCAPILFGSGDKATEDLEWILEQSRFISDQEVLPLLVEYLSKDYLDTLSDIKIPVLLTIGSRKSVFDSQAALVMKERMLKLVASADVFMSNMRYKALVKLGLTYEELKKVNASIIYALSLGWGMKGPLKDAPAYDIIAFWARGGYMRDCAEKGSIMVASQGVADTTMGETLSSAICAALFHNTDACGCDSKRAPLLGFAASLRYNLYI